MISHIACCSTIIGPIASELQITTGRVTVWISPIDNLIKISAEIVAAYVGNNSVEPANVPNIIDSVYAALTKLGSGPEMLPRGNPRTGGPNP